MHLHRSIFLAATFNPFNGVNPSFGPFNAILNSKVGMFLGLVWALAFCFCAYHLVVNIAGFARSRKNGFGDDMADQRSNLVLSGAAVIGLVAAPAIWAALQT